MIGRTERSGNNRASEASLTVMCGGKHSVFEAVKPILSMFAAHVVHVGEKVGAGHALKAINNTLNVVRYLL